MMESRRTYGWGGTGRTSKATIEKWEVAYRTESGGFGIVGWKTFKTEKEALDFGEEFQKERGYVKEFWAQHPSKVYSAY